MELPTSPTSSLISGLIEDLKRRLENKKYGEVGIRFVIHASTVTKYEKIDITSALDKGEKDKFITETDLEEMKKRMTQGALDKMKKGY